MIVGTLTLLSILFFGNSTEQGKFFQMHNIDKLIKEHVIEPSRQKKALLVSKEYSKTIEGIRKLEKKQRKKLEKLAVYKTTPENQVSELLIEISNLEDSARGKWIDIRLKAKDVFTEAEFQKIIKNEIEAKEMTTARLSHQANARDKGFKDLKAGFEANINDTYRKTHIIDALSTFEKKIDTLHPQRTDINFTYNDLLKNYHANREDLNKFIGKVSDYNKAVFKAYGQFHLVVINNTTDDEWKTINKEFISLLN